MIRSVAAEETTWGELPHKFEAGTAPMAEAVGFGAAIDYLEAIGFDAIERHEHDLAAFALEQLAELPVGHGACGPPADRRAGIVSFNVDGVHPHDVAQVLDFEGVAIRAGHHCCQPLMRKLGVAATNRASFYLYTIPEEVDRLIAGLHRVRKVFVEVRRERVRAALSRADPGSLQEPEEPRVARGCRRAGRGAEPALRRRDDRLRASRRGGRDRGRRLRGPRLRDQPGRDLHADRPRQGPDGRRGRRDAEGRAARGGRHSAHAGAAQVRHPRARRAQGSLHKARGTPLPEEWGPRRARSTRSPDADRGGDRGLPARRAAGGDDEAGLGRADRHRRLQLRRVALRHRGSLLPRRRPLAEGDWEPEECVVVCPRHGSRFEIATGRPLTLPPRTSPWRRFRSRSATGPSSSKCRTSVVDGSTASDRRSCNARRPCPRGARAARGRRRARARRGRSEGSPRTADRADDRALPLRLVSHHAGCEVLEIGGSRGYSTIWLAAARPILGGTVVSLEHDAEKCEAWRRNVAEAGLEEWAELLEGDAFETLGRLEEPFDVVFLDAEKEDYERLFALARARLEPGAVVVADNVLSHADTLGAYSAARQADRDAAERDRPARSRPRSQRRPVLRLYTRATAERRWSGRDRFVQYRQWRYQRVEACPRDPLGNRHSHA